MSMLILIAGPYRSGTHDDPALIRRTLKRWSRRRCPSSEPGTSQSWASGWRSLVDLAGSREIGDKAFNEVFHPIAVRLLEKCDGVLRVGGPSIGADEIVRVGRSLGLKIYTSLAEIPEGSITGVS